MGLSVRPLKNGDYEEVLVDWWLDWGWAAPPVKNFLPDKGTGGMIVYDEDIPICAGFIYHTNSGVALINWIISNKNYRKKPQRVDAIGLLIKELSDRCHTLGYQYVFTNNDNPYLVEHFKKQGYLVATQNSTELLKKWD